MKFSLLALALLTSTAHADGLYTCRNDRGDSVRINISQAGKTMSLRSLYAGLNLHRSQRRPGDHPDYTFYEGRYPSGDGYADALVTVDAKLARGASTGSVSFENDYYDCKLGSGKLKVSRETKKEFAPREERGEPCKLTSYYNGMTFMPPRIVCDYGNGMILMRSTGGVF